MISYELMERAWVGVMGRVHAYPNLLSMFVHPRTYAEIKSVYYHNKGVDWDWTNPATGHRALLFNGGFIERRRWVVPGWMMFHRLGINLGEACIEQPVYNHTQFPYVKL